MGAVETTVIKTQLPKRLLMEGEALVKAGWFRDLDDLFVEALRRYLDAHRPELAERLRQSGRSLVISVSFSHIF
jgi:hypothetical protein